MTQYLIATSVLETIVRGSLENDERLRVHTPLPLVRTRPVEIAVDGEHCFVSVHLDARMGEHLPSLAVQRAPDHRRRLGVHDRAEGRGRGRLFSGVFPVGV